MNSSSDPAFEFPAAAFGASSADFPQLFSASASSPIAALDGVNPSCRKRARQQQHFAEAAPVPDRQTRCSARLREACETLQAQVAELLAVNPSLQQQQLQQQQQQQGGDPLQLLAMMDELRSCHQVLIQAASSVEHLLLEASAAAKLRESPSLDEVGAQTLRVGTGELALHCLAPLQPTELTQVRAANCQWRRWAEADELWKFHARRRWPGSAALVSELLTFHSWKQQRNLLSAPATHGEVAALGVDNDISDSHPRVCLSPRPPSLRVVAVQEPLEASLYLRRCGLERNKVSAAVVREAASDARKYSILVELLHKDKVLLAEIRPVRPAPHLEGLQVPLALDAHVPLEARLPEAPEEHRRDLRNWDPPPLCLTLTAIRRSDGKLMRICHQAELDSFAADTSFHLPFRMGGDANDCLAHPASWTILSSPQCHHIALNGVAWASGEGQGQVPAIAKIETIFVGLHDPRDLLDSEAAGRLLTLWEEVGEWL